MALMISEKQNKNIWQEICREQEEKIKAIEHHIQRSTSEMEYVLEESRQTTPLSEYKASKHNPSFLQNRIFRPMTPSEEALISFDEFDPSISHIATMGYAFAEKELEAENDGEDNKPIKNQLDPKTCSPKEYLENYIFPFLSISLSAVLEEAKQAQCFKKRRSAFNACDFLTQKLYSTNPQHPDRQKEITSLKDIPFVKDYWETNPRPPLPKSLVWSEGEAALIIQCFWRGYLVRKDSEIQELRKWQLEWREMNGNAKERAKKFWAGKVPNGQIEISPE